MLIIDATRPVALPLAFERFWLAKPYKRGTRNVVKQI
jgi:hypothetical protein